MAAELGHMTVFPGGPLCSCGKRGHLESIASGTAIAKWVKSEIDAGVDTTLSTLEKIDARAVSKAAYQGDTLALSAFARAGEALGIAIVNFLVIFNPTCIIFGGGVSKSLDLLLPHIETALETQIFEPSYLDNLSLKTAALGDDTGLLGALVLARESIE
jgi:glucokinase